MNQNWINKLSDALNLNREMQDWGICNSDPTRISEFMQFFETNIPDHSWENEALAELIFQSIEEAIEEGISFDLEAFIFFVRTHKTKFPSTMEYWMSLTESNWRLLKYLKSS